MQHRTRVIAAFIIGVAACAVGFCVWSMSRHPVVRSDFFEFGVSKSGDEIAGWRLERVTAATGDTATSYNYTAHFSGIKTFAADYIYVLDGVTPLVCITPLEPDVVPQGLIPYEGDEMPADAAPEYTTTHFCVRNGSKVEHVLGRQYGTGKALVTMSNPEVVHGALEGSNWADLIDFKVHK